MTSLILIIMAIVIDIPVRYLRQSFSLLISCRFPLMSFSGQSVLYSAQIMLDVSQNAGDAFHVVEDVHTLCVGIIVHLKWTGNSLSKSPANNTLVSLSLTRFFQYWITWFFLCDQFVYETVFDFSKHFSFHVCSDFLSFMQKLDLESNIFCWPHFVLCFLKTLWNKVGILDCS